MTSLRRQEWLQYVRSRQHWPHYFRSRIFKQFNTLFDSACRQGMLEPHPMLNRLPANYVPLRRRTKGWRPQLQSQHINSTRRILWPLKYMATQWRSGSTPSHRHKMARVRNKASANREKELRERSPGELLRVAAAAATRCGPVPQLPRPQ